MSTRAVGNKRSLRLKGLKAEELACQYLENLGYKILKRNFLMRGGEIDIVARDREVLVFVEVKARYSHNYGLPIESITYFKLKALQKTALFYINKANWGERPYRFDLISIDYSNSFKDPEIELVTNITG